MDQLEARNPKFHPGWQDPKHLNDHLLPFKMHYQEAISEAKNPGLKLDTLVWDVGFPQCLVHSTNFIQGAFLAFLCTKDLA